MPLTCVISTETSSLATWMETTTLTASSWGECLASSSLLLSSLCRPSFSLPHITCCQRLNQVLNQPLPLKMLCGEVNYTGGQRSGPCFNHPLPPTRCACRSRENPSSCKSAWPDSKRQEFTDTSVCGLHLSRSCVLIACQRAALMRQRVPPCTEAQSEFCCASVTERPCIWHPHTFN